ncbi:MAG: hypothetical protein ACLUD0_05400 [Eubacterium ramulus]
MAAALQWRNDSGGHDHGTVHGDSCEPPQAFQSGMPFRILRSKGCLSVRLIRSRLLKYGSAMP